MTDFEFFKNQNLITKSNIKTNLQKPSLSRVMDKNPPIYTVLTKLFWCLAMKRISSDMIYSCNSFNKNVIEELIYLNESIQVKLIYCISSLQTVWCIPSIQLCYFNDYGLLMKMWSDNHL